MVAHIQHPDSHVYGLIDNCPRCAEHAEHPFDGLADRNLKTLILKVRLDDEPRSQNEAEAMYRIGKAILISDKIKSLEEEIGKKEA